MNSAIIELDQIRCDYHDKTVLDGLSLSVKHNEILCLLGPSGCGKTTALKVMAGLLPTADGNIHISGQQVNGKGVFVPPEKRHLGMIFQDYALFPHMTVAANVGFAIAKQGKDKVKAIVDEMLALVKLEGLGERYPHQLSGGQQQRVSIARALAYSPRLLLLDEPFSNIDTQVRLGLIEDIRAILKTQKMSAVFVTHSKEEGFAFADQMAVMNNGKIVQKDTPEQLFNHPDNTFVAEFLGKGVYLPATVLKGNQVQSPFGVLTSTNDIRLEAGIKGQLLVRPQYFKLEHGQANAESSATIEHKVFVGSGFSYQVKFAEFDIEVFSPLQFDVGQSVNLSVLPHQLHVFSA